MIENVSNIQHCIVKPIGNPTIMYNITANDGWMLHLINREENADIYSKAMALLVNRDWSEFEVVPESEVPELESE